MRRVYFILSIVNIILLHSSCTTTKDIYMFRDSEKEPLKVQNIPPPPEIKIKPFDNLYVSIKTLDQEVNSIFNPSNRGGNGYSSGTSSNYGDPASQYINGFRVGQDSLITLPILGKINFVGMSLKEAQDHLKSKAEEYLKEPTVEVKFLNFKVNIAGEVRTPGVYYNYEGNLNLVEALGKANGITDFADLSKVVIKRQNENQISTLQVNLTDNSVFSSEAFYIMPNDMIYVPPGNLKRRSYNSDTYGRLLTTISVLLLSASFMLNNL